MLNTLFTGRKMQWLERVDSTNRYMNRLLSENDLPEGMVVAALDQTAGRGQAEKYWRSEAGKNLLMTLYWKPVFIEADKIIRLSMIVAVSIQNMLEEYGIASWIKEPNDIYVEDKKIAGILIENTLRGSRVQHSIIGIGLNVNQTVFPDEIPNPVSMKLLTGKDFNLKECLYVLCNNLEKNYLRLKANAL